MKPTFRIADETDIDFILSLLEPFYRERCRTYLDIPYDEIAARITITETIRTGLCLVGSKSCAGVVFQRFPFNFDARIAHLLFWKVHGHTQIVILNEALRLCRILGFTHFTAAAPFPDCRINRWYAKSGFTACEENWIRRL